jgi:hypothetical protein
MSEKELIERGTAETFLHLYNCEHRTTYRLLECGDAPDVRCIDDDGAPLNLEITLTEDRAGDIQALLGRSDSRSLGALKAHLELVKRGIADPLDRFSALGDNVSEMIVHRIRAKMLKRYGSSTALVVRDTSGVDWDWELVASELKSKLAGERNPFDRGVWVLSARATAIQRLM